MMKVFADRLQEAQAKLAAWKAHPCPRHCWPVPGCCAPPRVAQSAAITCEACAKEFDRQNRVRLDGVSMCPDCVREWVLVAICSPSCPECGSGQLLCGQYDYGTDSETGYRDSGVICRCLNCGESGEPSYFMPSKRAQRYAEALMAVRP